jgi:HAE1 family hydrophobic/amphiphilic exporter-1
VAAKTLPRGYDIAWEGLSYDEAKRGNEGIYIFLVVLIFVYLVLAAQYESFVLPMVVILSLPVGVLGSHVPEVDRSVHWSRSRIVEAGH